MFEHHTVLQLLHSRTDAKQALNSIRKEIKINDKLIFNIYMNKLYLSPKLTMISFEQVTFLCKSEINKPNPTGGDDVSHEESSPNITEAKTSDQEGSTGNGGFVDPSGGWGFGYE